MNKNILVTYASKYGATREIAEKIGAVLQQKGLQADVHPIDGIRDLQQYKAVILGSALYIGSWQKDAEKFLKANTEALAGRPVWLFSSGPTGEVSAAELLEGQRLPASLQAVADRIQPRDVTVFHGYIDPDKVNFMEKWAVKNIVKKPMGDFRNWDMIAAWASGIADTLKAS